MTILKENCLLTLFGILGGVPLGIAMIYGMAELYNTDMYMLPPLITPQIFVLAALATLVFMMAAQLAALKKIYGLDFIDALKSRVS